MAWINTIANAVNGKLKFVRKAFPTIPPLLLLCEASERPGLSAMALTTAIIKRLSEAGIPTGVNPDGSPNIINKFVRIISEEVVKEIKDNLAVDVVAGPGSVSVTGTGAGPTGPITFSGVNIQPLSFKGIGK